MLSIYICPPVVTPTYIEAVTQAVKTGGRLESRLKKWPDNWATKPPHPPTWTRLSHISWREMDDWDKRDYRISRLKGYWFDLGCSDGGAGWGASGYGLRTRS